MAPRYQQTWLRSLPVAAGICLLVGGCDGSTLVGGPAPTIATAAIAVPTVAARHLATHSATVAKRGPLHGVVIGIDPGHNGRNGSDPSYINHKIYNGREPEACNTTGTETDGGYTESRFTFRVAVDLEHDVKRAGGKVVLTRHNNHGVGPCVNKRAEIINHAHAAVGVDIHGDGGPASGRGFAILEPVRDKENRHVIGSSARFGKQLRRAVLGSTSMPTSTYDGRNGINHRDDLAGLNLTRVPLVLIECGNMRNARDARLMTSSHFQHAIARAMLRAMTRFLHR